MVTKKELGIVTFKELEKKIARTYYRHKGYQSALMFYKGNSYKKVIGKMISKVDMMRRIINYRGECWDYKFEDNGSWWRYLFNIELK